MRLTLRAKLALIYGVVFFISVVTLESGLYLGARAALDSVVDRELRARLTGVTEYLEKHEGRVPWPQLRQSLLHDHEALQPKLLAIAGEDGTILFEAAALSDMRVTYDAQPHLFDAYRDGASFRAQSVLAPIHGGRYRILMASDLQVPLALLNRLWMLMLLSSPLALGIASAMGFWISGRALAPVAEISALARSIGAAESVRLNDLGRRVPVPDTAGELQDLSNTINGMLARIEETFQQITRFTADVSHELRTPLSVIRATSEIALLRVQPDERSYREALERILSESERNSALLEGMLRLARFDAGVERIQPQRVDLRCGVLHAAERFSSSAIEKRLTLTVEAGDGPKWIMADEEHLRWLWAILLDNAIKYTPPGGRITISLEQRDQRYVCSVTDSGIGIAAADQERIFHRFYRVDTSRSRSTGGAGLGLSIARQIVEAHQALIAVTSSPGQGTAFCVFMRPAPVEIARAGAVSNSTPVFS